jgi:PKD repeat protein
MREPLHPEESARHPERPPSARPRRTRTCFLLLLFPLALLVSACEDLPAPPNVAPAASFFYTPVAPITAGQTPVTFNADASRDTDGHINEYAWNWGDGTAAQSSSTSTMVHVFPDNPGLRCIEAKYAVQLTVTDDKGESSSTSQQVTVVEPPTPGSEACR